ncbi:unnamed protein product, partial [Rotaria sordida]
GELVLQIDGCTDNETLTLKNDGYQYARGKDPLISALYREWWFFTLYDIQIDIGFCIGYAVSDPAKTFGEQGAAVGGMLWTSVTNNTGQDSIDVSDVYNYEQFSAYKENATVTIDQNFIKVLDETTYQVVGSSRNEQIRWSLTFKQYSYACRQKEDVPELLDLDWISYMPSARVVGVIQYNNQNFTINTTGYHDHNYGAWPTDLFNWIWSQFHRIDKEFSFVLGAYHIPLTEDDYVGYIFIRYRGQRIKIGTLCGNQFHLKPLERKIIDGKKYSVHTKVETSDDNYKIDIEYKARVNNKNPGDRGLGLKVFEQISYYQVSFYQKQGQDWLPLEENLTGYGFSEWSHTNL